MSKIKLGIVAIAAVFVISAVASSVASAATAGWMVNGTMLSGSAALANTARVTTANNLEAANGLHVECTGNLKGTNPVITAPTSGSAGSVTFTGCSSKNANCALSSTEISTVAVSLSEITLDGTLAVKGSFVPQTKNTFATFKYEGELCSLSGVQPVTGKAKFLAHLGQDEMTFQPVLLQSATGDLKVGSSEASVSGAAELGLASGQAWSFL